MKKKLNTLTEDAKLDILDAAILIPILEEISTSLTALETRLAALEKSA